MMANIIDDYVSDSPIFHHVLDLTVPIFVEKNEKNIMTDVPPTKINKILPSSSILLECLSDMVLFDEKTKTRERAITTISTATTTMLRTTDVQESTMNLYSADKCSKLFVLTARLNDLKLSRPESFRREMLQKRPFEPFKLTIELYKFDDTLMTSCDFTPFNLAYIILSSGMIRKSNASAMYTVKTLFDFAVMCDPRNPTLDCLLRIEALDMYYNWLQISVTKNQRDEPYFSHTIIMLRLISLIYDLDVLKVVHCMYDTVFYEKSGMLMFSSIITFCIKLYFV
ncbi:unnamed protein product [Didymodactylos carnosus]|uniref:Uncharacterized protein n=1 Tax=Didymodactylos carnosus TaxID=1234261 RepID=A0A815KMK3_9BILA|nr:unnamed protein product [Didymodactylos carnosus]CAF4289441.1 unnamed protein product [Didymodactylos carnosus]